MYEDSNSWGSKAMPHGKAVEQYEYIKRAFTYKAFNSVIQGGAADIMKKSMLAVYKSGIFNEIPMAHLTVHDEMDYSIPKGKESVVKDIKDVMEKCYKLSVPLHVDMSMGKNLGEC